MDLVQFLIEPNPCTDHPRLFGIVEPISPALFHIYKLQLKLKRKLQLNKQKLQLKQLKLQTKT